MLPLLPIATIVGAAAGLTFTATGPGPAACLNLTSQLGLSKVQYAGSLEYTESQFDYWNAEQSQYSPSCVVYPTSAQDVSTALKSIKFAKSRFAVKGGGHNPNTFFSSVQSGVLIDLSDMTNKTYDPTTTLGTYQPGGQFGPIYDYFQQFGRTVVGARLAGVGTGLALGGGLRYLSGQYGMAVDSFRELEVVLPNGNIVTASPTQNSDLFFADRGGGGNAYGIVTKYTIQTRPSGTFYAGNIVYAFEQTNAVMKAITDFVQYNEDPKAAIIGTYEYLGALPGAGVELNQAVIMFLVYDGPDAGNAFSNFTSLPYLANTLGQKTFPEVVNMPIPLSTEASRGDNIFRVQNGGNAMQLPDGPWIWLNFLLTTSPLTTGAAYDAIQASFRDMVNSVSNAKGLPLFINDASNDQNPLSTFSTYPRLQQIKKKYDPDNFFAKYTGGWNFSAPWTYQPA